MRLFKGLALLVIIVLLSSCGKNTLVSIHTSDVNNFYQIGESDLDDFFVKLKYDNDFENQISLNEVTIKEEHLALFNEVGYHEIEVEHEGLTGTLMFTV